MGRPKTISTEQIVDAARALFMSKGFNVSTAEIAKAAGVSEGSIFNRFATKQSLFQAAMGIEDFPLDQRLDALVGTRTPRENLEEVCGELIAFFREALPRTMMVWATRSSDPIRSFRESRRFSALGYLKAMTRYLDAEMSAGRLRPCDPEVAARMLLGSLYNYAFFELVGVHVRMPIAGPSYIRALLDILENGLFQPEDEGVAGREEDAA